MIEQSTIPPILWRTDDGRVWRWITNDWYLEHDPSDVAAEPEPTFDVPVLDDDSDTGGIWDLFRRMVGNGGER